MTKIFMRSQDGNKLIFSYYNEDGSLWMTKEFQKITKGSFAKLSLKQYDDLFGAKRWAEGNSFFIIDDAPLPHPERLEGTHPDKLRTVKIEARLAAKKKSNLEKIIETAKEELEACIISVNMAGHKCLVKYCRGLYSTEAIKDKVMCTNCGHQVSLHIPKNNIKKIDKLT